jgi:hypothetical protein
MKKGVLLLATLLPALAARAQCETCSPVPGEIIDFCFTEAALPGQCASFSEYATHFHFESKERKKDPVLKLPLPPKGAPASIPFLLSLASDKKLKLGSSDLLFIEHAVNAWLEIDGLANWDPAVVFSGYTLLPSGLAFKPIHVGTGCKPTIGKTVIVHYDGYLADGKKFDSSLDRKKSYRFVLGKGQVIQGWDEGIALMNIGSRYFFRVPPELGYGKKGAGTVIPPDATLYFDVQLLAAE